MKNPEHEARAVPPGGSATINGVLYQILWTLLRASRAHIAKSTFGADGTVQEATIVLEPYGGGGDLVMQTKSRREVEQLKARPDGSTWSLKEVVEKVIPDLYIACTDKTDETTYRFVTEGRMGRWKPQYDFFRSIPTINIPSDPISDIDNTTLLRTVKDKKKQGADQAKAAATGSFWDRDTYTGRELFVQIVSAVRERKSVSDNESEVETQKNLRAVLANFEILGGQHMMSVREEIDLHLLAVVARNDDVSKIRDSLAMKLALLATEGSAEIDCRKFFDENGLKAIPLTEWGTIRRRCKTVTEQTVRYRGYSSDLDVRTEKAQKNLNEWRSEVAILAITGESGSGKSWTAYAIGLLSQSGKTLSAIVGAGGTTEETLNRASAYIWQGIAGHDESISLSRIAERVRSTIGAALNPWLTLVIDGVTDRRQAIELVQTPWEAWGIRLVLSINKRESSSLEQMSHGRCRVVTVENFTTPELHSYLGLFLSENWPQMPGFMRSLLQVPLLADIYRKIVVASGNREWIPQSEYALIAEFWLRAQELEPLDSEVLMKLAEKYLTDSVYPWPARDVLAAGAENATIQRLERAGWIRASHSVTGNTAELTHLRLLNWVCAIALLPRIQTGSPGVADVCDSVRSFFDGSSQQHGHRLSFVPMDLLWLLCQDQQFSKHIPAVIASLEGQYMQSEVLYVKLLPTIGQKIVDSLIIRLRESIDDWFIPSLVVKALAEIGGNVAVKAGHSLLNDNSPFLNLASCSIFSLCPSAEAIHQLWLLHNDCARNPSKYLREREKQNAHILYGKTFAALRACCGVSPHWLSEAIMKADPATESIADLAYLVASVELEQGRDLWHKHKAVLIEKMPAEKLRAIATCIRRFADGDEVSWLLEQLDKAGLIGVAAASALVRIDPALLLGEMHRIPRNEAVVARRWFLDHLFVIMSEETRTRIRSIMHHDGDVWSVAAFYNGRAHVLDVDTLVTLLTDLEQKLTQVLSEPNWGDREPFYSELSLLAQINTKPLVDHVRLLAGTSLESLLTQFALRIGPRTSPSRDSFVHEKAIELLFRIGGIGFTKVANDELRAESRFARLDGIALAGKRPDEESLEILTAICRQDETWDGIFLEQCRAAVVLAQNNLWDPVLQLVRKAGLKTLNDVTDLPRHGQRPPIQLISAIADALPEDLTTVSAGDVLSLGFGDLAFAGVIRSIADVCVSDGDVAHACVIAFELIQDHAEDNVPFLRNQLAIQGHSFSATNALIINGTQPALDSLAKGALEGITGAIAVNLIERSVDRAAAIEKTRATIIWSIQHDRSGDYVCNLHDLIRRLQDDAIICDILAHPAIVEYLNQVAFEDEHSYWRVGKKAAAIRCLSHINRIEAFLAAKSAMRASDSHDRDFYPAILTKLDPKMAVEVLFEQLVSEWSESAPEAKSIAWPIGRSLSILAIDDVAIRYLSTQDPVRRRAACFAAGWSTISDAVRDQLFSSLSDPDELVAREAAAAIDRRLIRMECQVLGHAVMSAATHSERWLYLDCLLALADPGDDHHYWPIEGPKIGNVLTPFQTAYVTQQLKKIRDKE